MDRDQNELTKYGVGAIYKESFKIMLKGKKIFALIIIALILPLAAIFLAHTLVSQLILYKVKLGPEFYEEFPVDAEKDKKLWIAFWSLQVVFYVVAFILTSLFTAAAVYTAACIGTSKRTTFKEVMKAMPRVWKRLIVTFLWNFVVYLLFNVVAGAILIVWAAFASPPIRTTTLLILLVLYIIGFAYITMLWQFANVVSILEDVRGWKATGKARKLMKGKIKTSVGCFFGLVIVFMIVMVLYELFVVVGWLIWPILPLRIFIGLLCGKLLIIVILYGLVVPTVLYFVCKAYHNDFVDSSSFS